MALSNSTINKLAAALTSEVIEFIYKDERWVEFLMEMVPEFLDKQLGEMDEDLMIELAQSIMDRIVMKPCRVMDS